MAALDVGYVRGMSDGSGRSPDVAVDARAPVELVVLVHGLFRTQRSMRSHSRALERAGFATRRFGYRSWRGRLAVHAAALARELVRWAADPGVARIHVVGHSLGNLVARAALGVEPLAKLGRVVMLVPPNHGSPVARWLSAWLGGMVPVLRELSDGPSGAASGLPSLGDLTVGVIAARFDHLVREASTHLQAERDHVLVTATHTSVLRSGRVQRLVIEFLRDGRFPRD